MIKELSYYESFEPCKGGPGPAGEARFMDDFECTIRKIIVQGGSDRMWLPHEIVKGMGQGRGENIPNSLMEVMFNFKKDLDVLNGHEHFRV